MNADVAERLKAIYAAADLAVAAAGPRCDASGRCCRFREYGHTLFISHIEADFLIDHAPALKEPVSNDACPFQVENLCTAREWRPLGCRVYFCDPNYQETGAAISERGVRELKALADEFGLGWRYAPLHSFLPTCHSDRNPESQQSQKESRPVPRSDRKAGGDDTQRCSTDRISLATLERHPCESAR